MGIDNYKFTEIDFANQGISELPTRPNEAGMSETKLKERFDNIPKVVIALGKINQFFDFLKTGQAGADIGVMDGANETKLQDSLDNLNQDKITSNPPIVGATKTKITYDSKGLVTSGGDLEKSDLPSDTLYEDSIINAIVASREDKIPSEKAIIDYVTDLGAGDMTKAIYDPTGKNTNAFDSENHNYDNSTSGLTATNVKDAIDETANIISTLSANMSDVFVEVRNGRRI